MIKKLKIVFLLIVVFIVIVFLIGKNSSGKVKMLSIQSNNLVTPIQPTLIPTPTSIPIIINSSSNLIEEVIKLAPDDFSLDFKALKEEVSKL